MAPTRQAAGKHSIDRFVQLQHWTDLLYVKPTPEGHVMRMLQPEELKLAMGWPREFRIEHGIRRDKIKMIGNAVCPKVMNAVVNTLCDGSRKY